MTNSRIAAKQICKCTLPVNCTHTLASNLHVPQQTRVIALVRHTMNITRYDTLFPVLKLDQGAQPHEIGSAKGKNRVKGWMTRANPEAIYNNKRVSCCVCALVLHGWHSPEFKRWIKTVIVCNTKYLTLKRLKILICNVVHLSQQFLY